LDELLSQGLRWGGGFRVGVATAAIGKYLAWAAAAADLRFAWALIAVSSRRVPEAKGFRLAPEDRLTCLTPGLADLFPLLREVKK
jgi:hypothetical protein